MTSSRIRSTAPPRLLGRTSPSALAWTCAVLIAAAWGASWVAHRLDERPVARADRNGVVLGAGSAIALPFGAGSAGAGDAVEPGAPQSPPDGAVQPSDLPPAVAALDGESAVHALYRLGARGRAGDARAAFDAFQVADFCAGVERLRAPHEARLERDRRICDGVTPALLAERYRQLEVAAQGGMAGAAALLLEAAGDGGADPPIERAIKWARRDASAGDLGALSAMTRLYQFGGAVEIDTDQALAFAVATEDRMQSRAEDFSPGELAMEHLLVVEFESKLGADRSEAAHRAASGIFVSRP